MVFTVSNNFPYKPIILEKYRLLPINNVTKQNLSHFKVRNIESIIKIISSFAYKKQQTKMPHGNVKEWESLGFVPQMFRFIQPVCYASIANKTNFRIKSTCTQVYF